MALYQLAILGPISIMTMANLNFVLCHTPADPLFPYVKYQYFVVCTVALNVFSYIFRYISFWQVEIYTKLKTILFKEKK